MMREEEPWAKRLSDSISKITADYVFLRGAAEGGSDRDSGDCDPIDARIAATSAATQTLIHIMLALDDLPELRGKFSNGPLPDLIAALDDLKQGKVSEIFRPAPQLKGKNTNKTEMLKLRAVTCVAVLERSGSKSTDACKTVSKIFADQKHKGKKGGPISASTLFDWCAELVPNLSGTVQQRILAQTLARLPHRIERTEALRLAKIEAEQRY
jgi:hypothetical protein